MTDVRRILFVTLLATAGCDLGPTSDWPTKGNGSDDEGQSSMDAGAGKLDAAVRRDSSTTSPPVIDGECAADAGDAGADAACAEEP